MAIEIIEEPKPKRQKGNGSSKTLAPDKDDVEIAIEIIRDAVASGYKFNNDQKDVGIMMSFDAISEPEQSLFHETTRAHNVPSWVTLWAQWRRSHEWGCAYDLLIDVQWQEMT